MEVDPIRFGTCSFRRSSGTLDDIIAVAAFVAIGESMVSDDADKELEMVKELTFDYEKGNFFRVIHVDGAHGGISPDGDSIIMSVFSERKPIPKFEIYDVEQGQLKSPPKKREVRKSIFREIEATLIMSPSTATVLMQWLSTHLEKHKVVAEKIADRQALLEQKKA